MGLPSAEAVLADLTLFGLDCGKEAEEAEAVAEKLIELSVLHRLTGTELSEELVAFAASKKNLLVTIDFLNTFEHEVLNKRANKPQKKKESHSAQIRDIHTIQELLDVEEEEENLLDSYLTPSKGSQKRSITTPENPRPKRTVSTCSPQLLFSPSSFSPSPTPSQKYISRSNRGEIVTSFGTIQGTSWVGGGGGSSTSVKLFNSVEMSLTRRYKFMFQDLLTNREVLSCKIEDLGQALKAHYKIEEFSSLIIPSQEPVTVLGQIGCDSNGRLNARSIILEGDQDISSGGQVPVDVSELLEYSFFPGQVVVMEGLNNTGMQLVASKVYEGVPLPFHTPTAPAEDSEPRMILVACGPYTPSDSIAYEPMLDLIDVINKSKPDVCILLGPFLDARHKQVENCHLTTSFEDVFKRCVKMLIDGTRSAGSHLILVPSLRDVHHDCVYPQPPFSYDLSKEDKPRVLFVSDPCTLEIDGVVLGLTSTDLLFHMGAEEISRSPNVSDRFSRILKHVLTQRSYYPIYPSAEEMNIDFNNFYYYSSLPVTPDVLITPSDLRYFVKDVLGCVCVNPGRLTKGQVGGTYGRLYIQPRVAEEERKSPCVAAQIVRI